jgi:hypothetical protein
VAYLFLVRRMTVHDRFTRTKRTVFLVLLIPWSIALVLGVTGSPEQRGLRTTIVMIALAVFLSGLACVYAFAFRCPRCRKSLAMISNRGGSSFPQDVRYCPYCGLDLELETDAVRNA